MKGRRRTTIFRPGLMSNLIIYYKLINYKCMDNKVKRQICERGFISKYE